MNGKQKKSLGREKKNQIEIIGLTQVINNHNKNMLDKGDRRQNQ